MAGLVEPRPWTGSYGADVAFALRRPRVVFRDEWLPHQIRLYFSHGGNWIAVSCNCRRGMPPFEERKRWDATDAIAVYRSHLE